MSISGALAAGLLGSGSAHAGLGGDVASVQADAAAFGGNVSISTLLAYDVQQIDVPGGLSVREFVGRDGIVFALSWTGTAPPDLRALLGGYLAEYTADVAARDHTGLRRALNVTLPDLIVQTGGHLRAYAGRAYLPSKLPAGVLPAEIR